MNNNRYIPKTQSTTTLKTILLLSLIFLFFATIAYAEIYGSNTIRAETTTTIKQIEKSPLAFYNRTVAIYGIIIKQCLSNGCWLFLKDETGIIFVTLRANNISVPHRIGRKAKVIGTVKKEFGNIYIQGKSVKIL